MSPYGDIINVARHVRRERVRRERVRRERVPLGRRQALPHCFLILRRPPFYAATTAGW